MAGRKTVTRRIIKLKFQDGEAGFRIVKNAANGQFLYAEYYDEDERGTRRLHPPFWTDDVLYVRETWGEIGGRTVFRADGCCFWIEEQGWIFPERWYPSIHMPKEAARLFLRVKSVRAEPLQDILKKKGKVAREGIPYEDEGDVEASGLRFRELWDSTIKHADLPNYGWKANPWVWVIEFERCEKPEVLY